MTTAHVAVALPSGGTDVEASRAFLQDRLALWAWWVFVLSFGFYLINLVAWTVLGTAAMGHSLAEMLVHPGSVLHLLCSLMFGAVWLIARRARLSFLALRALDVGTLVAGCAIFALMGFFLVGLHDVRANNAAIGLYAGLLAATNTVIARAIFVPSTPARTLWASTLALAPLVPVAIVATGAAFPVVNLATWCAVSIAVATVGSRVIFGLRTEAARVRRLGQYTLEERIGAGGMGIVYRASHAMLRRPTAIKLLPPERAGEANLARFEREVQITAQLSHPNTVAIYDYGRTPDGVFYYAMEFLDGINLEELVSSHGPQPPGRVIAILEQVCGSLSEAHGRGLVHRDVKPANIILTERGGEPDVAKVVDFGLVKPFAPDAPSATMTGSSVLTGTPLYMSPEALSAPDTNDPRSDLYAVGAVGYFLLTGHPVFEGRTVVEIIDQHLHSEPAPPSSRAPQFVSSDVDAVILGCLSKRVEDRPPSARSLRGDLARCNVAQQWTETEAEAWWRTFRTAGAPTAHRTGQSEGLTVTVDVADRLTHEVTRF